MTPPETAAAERLWVRLRLAPEPDALARALGVVLVAQAGIRSVTYKSEPECGWSVLDLDGLCPMRAASLKRRLQGLACVEELQSLAADA
jgi:hypothetical protein